MLTGTAYLAVCSAVRGQPVTVKTVDAGSRWLGCLCIDSLHNVGSTFSFISSCTAGDRSMTPRASLRRDEGLWRLRLSGSSYDVYRDLAASAIVSVNNIYCVLLFNFVFSSFFIFIIFSMCVLIINKYSVSESLAITLTRHSYLKAVGLLGKIWILKSIVFELWSRF